MRTLSFIGHCLKDHIMLLQSIKKRYLKTLERNFPLHWPYQLLNKFSEVYMFAYSIFSLMCPWSVRTARLAFAVLFLFLSTHILAIVASAAEYEPARQIVTPTGETQGVTQGETILSISTAVQKDGEKSLEVSPVLASENAPAAENAAVGQSPAQAHVAVSNPIDWNGIWTDAGVLIGGQFAVCGILYFMPQSVTQWSEEQKKNIFKHYGENFVDPIWDKDQFYINYILHPYWGGAYYIRGRERGLDPFSSFVYSALLSAAYEFGSECFFEKPSIQDLFVTPVAGSLLGAFVFEPWRNYIKNKPELYWYDHVSLIFTDPIGLLSSGFENLFGIKSTIMVNYTPQQQQKYATGTTVASKSDYIGATWKFQWN
jgi:hypothetical protein